MNAYIFTRDVFVHVLCWKTQDAFRSLCLSGTFSSLKKLKTLDAMSEDALLHTHMQTVGLFPREALFAECAETIARAVSTLCFTGIAHKHRHTRARARTYTYILAKNQQRRYSRRLNRKVLKLLTRGHFAMSLCHIYV